MAQKDRAEAAAAAVAVAAVERKTARRMLWLTLLAVVGTWVSIVVAIVAILTAPAK